MWAQSRAEHYPKSCPIAQALSRYGEVFPEVDTWEPETDPHREELKDLLRRRRQFIDQRVQEKGRLDKGISTTIAKSTKRHIAWLEKEIARLDQAYQAVLQDNVTLAERAALYRTVPGIGPLTAATLVAQLSELGHWDSQALTSLVGLAPWSRDSGKKRGHRAIRGGRGLVRRALYMCAWAVIRHDSEMRRFYDRLRQRGKPGNVAVVVVMRKILLQLNAVARRGTPWVPQDASTSPGNPTKRLDFEHGYLTGRYSFGVVAKLAEWANCIICWQSADPICAGAAMSNSIVRRTVWITAGVWAVLILAVIIQSMLGVTVAGARPEASRLIIMMTLPFTVGMSVVAIGAAMAIGWWRSRRPAASGND